jgi:hypothetical protein
MSFLLSLLVAAAKIRLAVRAASSRRAASPRIVDSRLRVSKAVRSDVLRGQEAFLSLADLRCGDVAQLP